jgi:hypothetical protein
MSQDNSSTGLLLSLVRWFEMLAQEESKFLVTYTHDNTDFCDRLIHMWQTEESKEIGKISIDSVKVIDKDVKDSIDSSLYSTAPELNEYCILLQQCITQYIKKYSYCGTHAPWGIIERVNIQYYAPGGGYKIWHSERNSGTYPVSNRHLVFMTYLNTVDGEGYEGGTEWFYQEKKVKAVKGKTAIWPADWTFTHRGIVSPVGEKYIITGWLSFLK